ncbi:hypothetical protein IWT25_02212 [Secundilactobacillus pentosiphilus]|uniref:Uncharacterized protein n=1 Tax=Secundilactobacillus pentosiphilus TaxID=1714682 RepID=A0A1Z5IYJ6_9LACO|nr:hypothetical protein IWT25_02212 [Secundilactobacillus pentosiphilus]
MVYKHQSELERDKIEILWKQGNTQADIVRELHRNLSTVKPIIKCNKELISSHIMRFLT